MTIALMELAAVAGSPSRPAVGIGLAVFGLGFGMVGQVLIVAVQNAVDRSRMGVAMAATSFSRGLGGAVGAALLGAVFASRATGSPAVARAGVIDGVQAVFIAAAPVAALALVAVLLLRELPLSGREPTAHPPPPKGSTWQTPTDPTTETGGRATAASAPATATARRSQPSSANST
jgi:MFS family permease